MGAESSCARAVDAHASAAQHTQQIRCERGLFMAGAACCSALGVVPTWPRDVHAGEAMNDNASAKLDRRAWLKASAASLAAASVPSVAPAAPPAPHAYLPA